MVQANQALDAKKILYLIIALIGSITLYGAVVNPSLFDIQDLALNKRIFVAFIGLSSMLGCSYLLFVKTKK